MVRVVSLACSNTEIVCALGHAAALVGVDDHSDWPPEVVGALPRVGPDLAVDVAAVAALEPDLVLASLTVPGHERVVEAVERAGLPFLAPEPVDLAGVLASVREIAGALGDPPAGEALVAEMERGWAIATPPERRPSVLVQWWPRPVIAPGGASWVRELVERAGGRSPLAHEPVKSRPLDDAEVAALALDAIVLSWCGVEPDKVREDVVYRNPAWQGLAAVRDRRVYRIPEAYLGRPSPRLIEGYRRLCAVVSAVAPAPSSEKASASSS
ncbi:MAG TPA: helical backbone metal receptor [Thermoanaerobaculia bacterium]|nr:helical backbone metal receptor [Thermoanaerobaculia bacterium]